MLDKNTESVLYVQALKLKEKSKIRNFCVIKLYRDEEKSILKILKIKF